MTTSATTMAVLPASNDIPKNVDGSRQSMTSEGRLAFLQCLMPGRGDDGWEG